MGLSHRLAHSSRENRADKAPPHPINETRREMSELASEMLEIARAALNEEYKHLLPPGFTIHRLAEYDPSKHKAPHLLFEMRERPDVRYIAWLTSDTASFTALGETLNDAVKRAIATVEKYKPSSVVQ
jgi:hypothetical protein